MRVFLKYLGIRFVQKHTSITTKIAHNLTHERHNFVLKNARAWLPKEWLSVLYQLPMVLLMHDGM